MSTRSNANATLDAQFVAVRDEKCRSPISVRRVAIAEASCWLDPDAVVGIEAIIDVAGNVRICLRGRSRERESLILRVAGYGWLCRMVEQIDLHKQVGSKLIKNIRPVYANKSSFVDLRPVE